MSKRIHRYYDEKTLKWFDLFLEGILILDEYTVVEYVNDSYLDYSGLTREQIIGKVLNDVRPGAVAPHVYEEKKAVYNYNRKVGKTESYVDVIPVFEKEDIVGSIIVVRDIKVLNNLFNQIEEKNDHISQLKQRITDVYSVEFTFADVIGSDADHWKLAKKAAQIDSSVLLVGESGTGKEVMAQSIHSHSKRRNNSFIDINCAALPDHLLESELFGYEAGAFTGANKSEIIS